MTETNTHHCPCPNCGREMEFDPVTGALGCGSCGERNDPPPGSGKIAESDFHQTLRLLETESSGEEGVALECANCGAEIILPPDVAADRCAYCGSPVVGGGKVRRYLRPTALLPFAVPRERGVELYRKWLEARWFLPGTVRQEARLDSLNGVYMPYWTYNCDTVTRYTGLRGEHYYVTQTYTTTENGRQVTRTRQVQRTRWFPVSGTVGNRFDDLLVPGGKSLPEALVNELEPWPLNGLKPYHPDFIRGFREEVYTVKLDEGFTFARKRMLPEIDRKIRADIGGDVQSVTGSEVDYRNIAFKHLLLPLWISSFLYRGKHYRILVNAQTGEVQGERPWSAWKITLFVVILLAVFTGIFFLFSLN